MKLPGNCDCFNMSGGKVTLAWFLPSASPAQLGGFALVCDVGI